MGVETNTPAVRPAYFLVTQDALRVYSVLQTLARLKLRLVRRRNLDLFAGPGVTALGGLPLRNVKRAKSDQADFSTAF